MMQLHSKHPSPISPLRVSAPTQFASRQHDNAFEEIKRRLCAARRLAHLNLEVPFTLYTNASKIAVGAVLFQQD